VEVYSRNSECNTTKYPDLIAMLPNAVVNPAKTKSYVLDCEAVAYDRVNKTILPFQILSTRKRKVGCVVHGHVTCADVRVAAIGCESGGCHRPSVPLRL